MDALVQQFNKRFPLRLNTGLGCGVGLAIGLAFPSAVLLPDAARADIATSIVSTPLASEIAASSAQQINLASLLNWGKSNNGSGTATVTTFNLSEGGSYGLNSLAGSQFAGGSSSGLSLFYFNSGSGLASGLNGLMPSTTAYGMLDHLSFFGKSASATAPAGARPAVGPPAAASSAQAGSLTLSGQFYLSNASAPTYGASSSLFQSAFGNSAVNTLEQAPGATNQAYDQHLAYAGKNVGFNASFTSIDKDFSDGGAFGSALASDDQATRDAANSLLNRRGQDEQTFGLNLGAAKEFGQFTFNMDDFDDKVNDKKTGSQSIGYTWGDLKTTQFTFQSSSSSDLIGHTHNNLQTFGLNQAFGKLMSLQASRIVQNQGAFGSATSTTDNLHLSLTPEKRLGIGMDATEKIESDTFGGSDKVVNLNLHRTLDGLTLGVLYGDEQRKNIASAGATAALASIRTMGFSANKQISKLFSVDTNWQLVHDTSQAKGQRRIATEATHLNFTPIKDFLVKDQYTTNGGINNRQMSASYALPKSAFASLGFGPVTLSLNNTQINGINSTYNQASMQTQKVALDTTLPRRISVAGLLLPSFLSTDTTLHLELGQARIDDFKNSSGQLSHGEDANVEAMKMGGSLTVWKAAHWSYTFASQTATNAGQTKLPDAHEFDFTAPISKLTLTAYDHDQVDQGGGNYKHATDKHVSLGGALTKTLTLAFDTGESRDYTLANPSHTRMMGVHLTGKHGALQNIDLKLQRQLESEYHNGRNNQTIYGVNFNLPQTTTRRLSLNCAVTDNKYINRPAATGKMDATVGFDFAQQF